MASGKKLLQSAHTVDFAKDQTIKGGVSLDGIAGPRAATPEDASG